MFKFVVAAASFIFSIGAYAQSSCEQDRANSIASVYSYCNGLNVIGCGNPGTRLPVGVDEVLHPEGGGWLSFQCWFDNSCDGGSKVIWHTAGAAPCSTVYNSFPSVKMQTPRNQRLVCGSIVEHEKQVLGESIEIAGTPISLNYFTSWSQGRSYDYEVSIPISGDTLRSGIDSFDIILRNGETIIYSENILNDQTNYTHNILWNGLDNSSNPTLGSLSLNVQVIELRSDASSISVRNDSTVGAFKSVLIGLGGWVPSKFAFYDIAAERVYMGTGEIRSVVGMPYGSDQYLIATEDSSQVYIFNSNGLVSEIKTALLGTTVYSFSYDTSNKLISITQPFGRVMIFDRDLFGTFVSITSSNGFVTLVEMDTNGLLKKFTNPNLESYEMTYDSSSHLLKTFKKPMGQISTFNYDLKGHLVKDSHSGGNFFDLVRDWNSYYKFDILQTTAMGRKTQITSNDSGTNATRAITYPNGSWGNYTYSISGNELMTNDIDRGLSTSERFVENDRFGGTSYIRTSESHPFGNSYSSTVYTESVTSSDSLDPFSVTTATYTMGLSGTTSQVTTTFEESTREYSSISTVGNTSKVKVDIYERPVEISQGNLATISISYLDDKLTQISQGSLVENFNYSSMTGLLSTYTNSSGKSYGYTYDSVGRLSSIVYPDLRVTQFSYDSNGNVASVTPPGRPIHSFSLTSSELPRTYVAPALTGVSSTTATSTYNLDKQLLTQTKPDGTVLNYTYGSTSGLLESINIGSRYYSISNQSLNRLPEVILTPDNVRTIIDYSGPNIRGTTNYLTSGHDLGQYYFNLNPQGQMNSDVVYAGSAESNVSFTYDLDGNMVSAGDLILTYTTPNSQLSQTSIANLSGVVSDNYTYNNRGEVDHYQAVHNSNTLYDLSIVRDSGGKITEKTEVLNAVTNVYNFAYDDSTRLSEVKKNSVVVSNYIYDSNGNRVSGNIGAQTTTGIFDDQDRVTAYNVYDYTHNANGELTSKTNSLTSAVTMYSYDDFGKLSSVTLPSSDLISYEIDGLGRRIGKKLNGVVQKRWVYSDGLRIVAELDASGVIVKRFIYASKTNIPDYMIYNGESYRLISDYLGSLRLVIKVSDGSLIQRMNHDEFGHVVDDTNPGFVPFGYAGGLYDSDTNLIRFGFRDYDPEVGRWTSKDPILFAGGDTNLYGYVQNDPVNWTDPTGLKVFYFNFNFSWGAANNLASSQGSFNSISLGVGFDTDSLSSFFYSAGGKGSTGIGAFGGASFGGGYFEGNKCEFAGAGTSTSSAAGYGFFGGGFNINQSSGKMGYGFDIYGPGFGFSANRQNTQTYIMGQ